MQNVAEYLSETVEGFCEEIGLGGKLKCMIVSGVKSEVQLSNFKSFIVENEFKNKFIMVSQFLMSMDIRDNISMVEFNEKYNSGEKVYALESVCRGHYSNEVLHKVELLLKNGLTLNTIYSTLITENKLNVYNVLNLLK